MLGFSQAPRANILTQIERRGRVGEDKENETGGGGRKEMVEFEGKEGRTENRKVPNRTCRFISSIWWTIFSAHPFVVDTQPSPHPPYITLQNSKIKWKGPFLVALQWKRTSGDERRTWVILDCESSARGAAAARLCPGWSGPDDNIITASSGSVRLNKQCPSFPPKVCVSFPGNFLFGPAQEEEDKEKEEEEGGGGGWGGGDGGG